MKALTAEWVEKAEADLRTAEREIVATHTPNYDAVCFHAQQCIEKFLKARLTEADIPFPRTHDLTALLDLVLPVEPSWESIRSELARLTDYAVEFRYPGQSADGETAKSALEDCRKAHAQIRTSLPE